MRIHSRLCAATAATLCVCAGAAVAQDSVATTPGGNDALAVFDAGAQRVRYVLDGAPLATSWGAALIVGPALKSARSADPMFNTTLLGANAVSAARLAPVGGINFPARSFAQWNGAGPGVNPAHNGAPGAVSVSSFDWQFTIGFSDLPDAATGAVGAIVGQQSGNLSRFYVERVVGASGRANAGANDTATLSLGGADATGFLTLRADTFNAPDAQQVKGENLVRIDLGARTGGGVNTLSNTGGANNLAADAGATAYVVNNGPRTLHTPAATSGAALGVDFAGQFISGAAAAGAITTTDHLDSDDVRLRGGPSYSVANTGAGTGGTVATLAKTLPSVNGSDAIHLFALDSATPPDVVNGSTIVLTLPSPIAAPGFSANASGDARFAHNASQTPFRGPNGPVGVGQTAGGALVVAATALDPTEGEFIAVATENGGFSWTVAAHAGKSVLDGPGGAPIGALSAGAPVSVSPPAVDLLGNVYFVSRWQPAGGGDAVGLFRAVNTPSGYQLERVLTTGQTIAGVNSATPYTVSALSLADSDSIASGAFHAGAVLQHMVPGAATTDPANAFAFGALVVNAVITYERAGGVMEEYDAVLLIAPATGAIACPGDTNGDNVVDFTDFSTILAAYGSCDGQPAYNPAADLDGSGCVDFADFSEVLANYGVTCE